MTEIPNQAATPNAESDVWSTTAYHGAPIEGAELIPKEHPKDRAFVTDIVDASGGPQRALIDGSKIVGGEQFVQVTPIGAEMNPVVVKKSELVARRPETQAARAVQWELADQALKAMRVEPPVQPTVEPFNDPFSNAGPRPKVVRPQG